MSIKEIKEKQQQVEIDRKHNEAKLRAEMTEYIRSCTVPCSALLDLMRAKDKAYENSRAERMTYYDVRNLLEELIGNREAGVQP